MRAFLLPVGALIVLAGSLFFTSAWQKPGFEIQLGGPSSESLVIVTASNRSAKKWLAGKVEARNDWSLWLAVEWKESSQSEARALLGSWVEYGDSMHFKPAVPPKPGSLLQVRFQPTKDLLYQKEAIVGKPDRPAGGPLNVSILPSAAELPANALKIYLHFSQPMEQNVFLERLKLLRADGAEVVGAFRETELWSPDGRRLTVWLHPGRQKTGVNLNEDEGAVLKEGETYVLQILGGWRSVSGQMLGKDVEKRFRAVAADHTRVDPQTWIVHAPKTGSRDALRIEFGEPLDHAMLADSLLVQASGQAITGRITISPGEREWSFVPDGNWPAGKCEIKVSTLLEDLAGNNVERTFETVEHEGPPPHYDAVLLSFSTRS